jgi:hypothetical protein
MAEPKKEIVEISLPLRPAQPDARKNETARISLLPRRPRVAPAINATQPAPVIRTPQPVAPIDTILRPLCWTMLGISVLIFLIQIWNYVVS